MLALKELLHNLVEAFNKSRYYDSDGNKIKPIAWQPLPKWEVEE